MNNSSLSIKRVLLALLVVCIAVFSFFVFWYLSTQKLTVLCKNCTAYVFTEKEFEEQKLDKGKKIDNEKTIRLNKGDYIIGYKGENGFSDGNITTTLGSKPQTETINPSLSPQKLSEILKEEKPQIDKVLISSFSPTISQYTVGEGQLLEFGDWYITTLIYAGNDVFNADSLRVIMKKSEGGKWRVAISRPEIVINKNSNPHIPGSIIDSANQLQSPLADRFLSEQDRHGVNQ